MPQTMKAAVIHEFGTALAIEEWNVPDVPADRIMVKIEACGVCHTDLHAAEGDWPVNLAEAAARFRTGVPERGSAEFEAGAAQGRRLEDADLAVRE